MFPTNDSSGVSGRRRTPLLAFAILALLAGMWAGLLRMGWGWPPIRPTLPMAHGPLMVSGFLGTLICLERAIGLGPSVTGVYRKLVYLPALASGVGGVLVMVGILNPLGPVLITLGSAGLVILMAAIYRLHPTFDLLVILLGALLWLIGNIFWLLGWPVYQIVPWWTGFLVFTIAGERLELSRLLNLSALARRLFMFALALFAAGLIVSVFRYQPGMRTLGFSLIALALWLLHYDIARRRARAGGQAQFIAIALLSGYFWLGISGVFHVIYGGQMAGPYYDAMLHAFYLGFVFSMIFAHAPIVFPAVLGSPMPFSTQFYGPLILLQLSLVLRIAGDLSLSMPARRWGGLLNAVALLFFLFSTLIAIRQGRRG